MITLAHPYYREVYTSKITIPDPGLLEPVVFQNLCNGHFFDLLELEKAFISKRVKSKNPKVAAEKHFLYAIALSNLAFHRYWGGKPTPFPSGYKASIHSYLSSALQILESEEYTVAAIQLLFRIGDVEHAYELISVKPNLLSKSPVVIKIMFMTYIFEKDYSSARKLADILLQNPHYLDGDWLTTIALVCVLYKTGVLSDSFIDFTSLINKNAIPKNDVKYYGLPCNSNGKTTVLTCCDEKYFYAHAIDLFYSVYKTNKNDLNFHFHIYNMNEKVSEDIEKIRSVFSDMEISFSSEDVPPHMATPTFYASQRYVFAEHALNTLNTPVLVVDADSLFRNPWQNIASKLKGKDLLLNCHDASPLWEDVLAGFNWFGGGEISKQFANTTAKFIKTNLDKGNHQWFLDQIALSVAADRIEDKQAVVRVDSSVAMDINHHEASFSWVVTTIKDAPGKYQDYKAALRQEYGYPWV